ncbi:MAG TPA: Mur ligase family protein [Gemmatimonadales bacterium]|nr:Mur ligase family protein [Gemmatimonadales bacterium]
MLDVAFADADGERLVTAWERRLREVLDLLRWPGAELAALRWPGGASLAFAAPPDVLYAATEINEWAWDAGVADVLGGPAEPPAEAARRLGGAVAAERKPALIALLQAARDRHAAALVDDEMVSVGLGAGSRAWALTDLPTPALVPWEEIHDVPLVLVTGSNGKTTTTRMLAAIAAAAGHVPGWSCTDGIWVGGEAVETGDWAGPGGARRVLRDRRVEFAVLETARGGILRRGLPVTRAAAAIVTNVAEDHFGEYGVSDLEGLAAVKLVVGRAIGADGRLVLNAEDPALAAAAAGGTAPMLWFAEDAGNPVVGAHLAAGGDATVVEGGVLTLRRGWTGVPVLPVAEVPATFGGRLGHNVRNALAAAGAAWAAGLEPEAIARGLRSFRGGAEDNPGRANVFRLGDDVTAVVDFAHNPHGVAAIADVARLFPGAPRTVLLGQAGDRDDRAIRDLARSAWALRPARVILKDLVNYLRGRAPGELPALMRRELLSLGCPPGAILDGGGDLEATRLALGLAQPGDLLLLLVHERQAEVLALLARLERDRWRPGLPLPA